jgi:hypothetical protein
MPAEELIVVNAPEEGLVKPIVVLSIAPPSIFTVSSVACPVLCRVVNLPVV